MNSAMNLVAKLLASAVVSVSSTAWAECDKTVAATTPAERFIIESHNVVKDLDTGLQWQRCPLGANWSDETGCEVVGQLQHSWDQALAAGQDGWRLPNKKELASIIEYQCRAPALNQQLFPALISVPSGDIDNAVYWTSTPLIYFSQPTVWAIDFADGAFVNRAASEGLKVRLVRD